MTDNTALCRTTIYTSGAFQSRPCGRVVYRDGLCKMHHGHAMRRQKKADVYRGQQERDAVAVARVVAISEALHFSAAPVRNPWISGDARSYLDTISFTLDDFLDILAHAAAGQIDLDAVRLAARKETV